MKIRDTWNAQADESNQFDSLDSDEIERFADETIEALGRDAAEYKKLEDERDDWKAEAECNLDLLNQAMPEIIRQGRMLEALGRDAREMAEWAAINAPEYLREMAERILDETKEKK